VGVVGFWGNDVDVCIDAVLPCVGLRVGLGQHRRTCIVLSFVYIAVH
jgi:hypothetical protein